MAKIRILSSDFLNADLVVDLKGNEALARLLDNYQFQADEKYPLDDQQFHEISAAVAEHSVTAYPGGSSANVLSTLSKLMGNRISCDFIGVTGNDTNGQMVRSAMDKDRIRMLPGILPPGTPAPETVISYVIRLPEGRRITATWPANTRHILKPDLITDAMVQDCDAVLVQGAMWKRLDWEYADKLLDLRWKHGKELWLALPTTADFSVEKKDFFNGLIPSANLVFANMAELARVAGVIGAKTKEGDITPTQKKAALQKLQAAFNEHYPDREKMPHGSKQVGFITDDQHEAFVVTRDKIIPIEVTPVPSHEIVDKVGAGDTAFAGFLFGYLQGKNPEVCAYLGTGLAAEKVKCAGPRLADPVKALRVSRGNLTHLLGSGEQDIVIEP